MARESNHNQHGNSENINNISGLNLGIRNPLGISHSLGYHFLSPKLITPSTSQSLIPDNCVTR